MPAAAVVVATPVLGGGLAVAMALACRAWVMHRASPGVVSDRSDLAARVRSSGPQSLVLGVVLGAGLRPDGSPTDLLARRVEAGADLYRRGLVDRLVMSGAVELDGRRQPEAMAALARSLGVPGDHIDLDPNGFDTAATCRQLASRDDGGPTTLVVLVTQEFHIHRALYLARRAGLRSLGCPSPDAEVRPAALAKARTREIPAAVKAVFVDRFERR